jgi:hypothetical protein
MVNIRSGYTGSIPIYQKKKEDGKPLNNQSQVTGRKEYMETSFSGTYFYAWLKIQRSKRNRKNRERKHGKKSQRTQSPTTKGGTQ